jgi:hypothetical protein
MQCAAVGSGLGATIIPQTILIALFPSGTCHRAMTFFAIGSASEQSLFVSERLRGLSRL